MIAKIIGTNNFKLKVKKKKNSKHLNRLILNILPILLIDDILKPTCVFNEFQDNI